MTGLWRADASYECVALEELAVELPVGLEPWEMVDGKAQRITVTIELYRRRGALHDATIEDCIDYGALFSKVTSDFHDQREHTPLLETIAEELIELCFEDERVEACRVTLRKPHVLNGRAVPRLEVYRVREIR